MPFSLLNRPFQIEALMHMDGSPDEETGWQYDPGVLTYSFSTNADATFRGIYNSALTELEGFINVDFQQTADEAQLTGDYTPDYGFDASADLRFSQQTSPGTGGYAEAYWWTTDGDDDMEDIDSTNRIWTVNEYTILHEIGHALTLKHTSPYQNPEEEPYLQPEEQNNNLTVMHYHLEEDGENSVVDPDWGEWIYKHFQLYDVLALQLRFGANMSTYSGNTTHTATSLQIDQWLRVLWDASGADTINMSGQTRSQTIDLREGHFSNIGSVAGNNPTGDNLAIAFGAVIENATGGSGTDSITGNAGANVLHGGGGAGDVLIGLGGNDTYYTDVASTQVIEAIGGGNDTLYTAVGYALAAGQEVETLSTNNYVATTAINLTGNGFNQTLLGNAGANTLHGGGGTDTLIGLGGNDSYYADVATVQIVEAAGGGTDALYTSVSYALGGAPEVETLSVNSYGATSAINLTGNGFNQTLIGNAGMNALHGGGGTDTLIGLGGNDTYHTDVAATQVIEAAGGGTDALYTAVSYALASGQEIEILSVNNYSATTAINLTGNAVGQTVTGNAGGNTLNGGGGNDSLYGLGGSDFFQFTTTLGSGNVDAIIDFSVVDDTISLDDAIFTAAGSPGALNVNAFYAGNAAHDADDRIIYNSATGQLFYDPDGTGANAAVQFATLATGLALTASDFTII